MAIIPQLLLFILTTFLFWLTLDPKHWKYLNPTCGGKQQSPIDMKTSKVKTDTRLWKFDFSKLSTSKNVKFEITNNGHTGMY